jgi:hypothetical protein
MVYREACSRATDANDTTTTMTYYWTSERAKTCGKKGHS